jgi:hypothetical protein
MGSKWSYYFAFDWPNYWTPFSFMRLSFHLMARCFVFPHAWGAADHIRILDYPEGAVLTRTVYWQWLWFQVRWQPKIRSQAD